MKNLSIIPILLIVLLSGCQSKLEEFRKIDSETQQKITELKREQDSTGITNEDVKNQIQEIRSKKASLFLQEFNHSLEFQLSHMADTIEFIVTDEFDEPGSGYTKRLPKDSLLKLVLAEPKCSQTDEEVTMTVESTDTTMKVILQGADTGFRQEFTFTKNEEEEYILVTIKDDSV